MIITRPLEGLVVVETDALVSLAACGKVLAALGATVYVRDAGERFAGEPALRAYLDDGKREVLSDQDIDRVDILLTTADRAGLHPARDPRQIRVVFSDFGGVGPRGDWVGSDLVAQAAGGLLQLIGEAGKAPVRLGGNQLDHTVGLAAFSASMVALHARERTGRGQQVDVSRLETTAFIEWKGGTYAQAGAALERGESSGPVVVRCSDGAFGLFYRPSDWAAIVDVLDADSLRDERFATQQGRIDRLEELTAAISAVTVSLTRQELYERLQARGVPAGPVLDARDLLASPQYQDRAYLVPLEVDGDSVLQPGLPFVFNTQRPVADDVARAS